MTVKSKKFQKGIITKPTTSATTEEGEIRNDSADNKQKVFTEGAEREIITADQTQELSNKTIDSASNTITVDADEATVENLEVDNLKAGVLETDLTNAVDDTKLPSAQAVKTYVADQVATKDEASEITFDDTNVNVTGANVQAALDDVANSAAAAQGSGDAAQTDIDDHIADAADAHAASAITNTPSGNLAATDVQGALDELQTDVDSRALASDLSDHLVDPVDAHDASTISNAPSGNLVATDVQSALDELQGDIDTLDIDVTTAQTTVDNHIADASDAHDASAISNIAAGNLAATNVQDALNELQADVDTRADATDLSNHTGATSGVHGVTGDVVGTTDTQTLTNKTIQGASVENPVRLDPKKDTKANLETYATTATNGELVFATDEKQAYQIVDAELVSIGGSGVGGVDIFHVERFEQTEVADATTGNNSTFLGGGSIAGTLIDQEVSPLKGDRSFQYTQAAGSLNDYIALPEVVIDTKEQGNTAGVVVYTSYDGNDNEIDFVVYDNTGTEVIARLPLKRSTKSLKQELIFNVPSGSTGLRYGIQTVVENSGAVLVFDEIEFKLNPLAPTDIYASKEYTQYTPTIQGLGGGSSISFFYKQLGDSIVIMGDLTTASPTGVEIQLGLPTGMTVDSTKVTTIMSVGYSTENSAGSDHFSLLATGGDSFLNIGLRGDSFGSGLTPQVDSTVFGSGRQINFVTQPIPITELSENSQGVVINGVTSSDIANADNLKVTFDGTDTGTHTNFSAKPEGWLTSITRNSAGNYTLNLANGSLTATPTFSGASAGSDYTSPISVGTSSVNFQCISDGGGIEDSDFVSVVLSKLGEDYVKESERTVVFPNGLKNPTVYIKDVKSNGTQGGTATSGSYVTRDLNTIEGDSYMTSLSSNQIELYTGRYRIEGDAPAFVVDGHKAILYNVTNAVTAVVGSSELTTSAGAVVTESTIKGEFEVTDESNLFEIRHRVNTTRASDGFGVACSFGDDEIYTVIKLVKIG